MLLADETHRVNWISYGSYKCRIVVRSVFDRETYAFADFFDVEFPLRHDISKIIGRTLPLTILTDCESLFKTLVKSSTTSERRLTIDIRAAWGAFNRNEIANVRWVWSKNSIADGLTKVDHCESMEGALCNERTIPMIEQWIKRVSPINNYLWQQNSDNGPDYHHKEPSVLINIPTAHKPSPAHDISALAHSNHDTTATTFITDTATRTQFTDISTLTNRSITPTCTHCSLTRSWPRDCW